MLNLNSQKSSNLEESKEIKADISNETEIIVDDVEKPKLNESNAQLIRGPQNSTTHIGKYEL